MTYDHENIADAYIGYILSKLRKVVNCLVVVCNYEYIQEGIYNIQPYADEIFYRKNIGFDAGAYKDTICKYLGFEEIDKYDELLLVNDSFYGPLYPIEEVFDVMEKVETDYWGLIKAPAGILYNQYLYDSHIQSYFLAFRKNMLKSTSFKVFWETMDYPDSLGQAVINFELRCNQYFSKLGFRGVALTEILSNIRFKKGETPYLLYPLELVRDIHIPIIKRGSFDFSNTGFGKALEALNYIEENGLYNIDYIWKHLSRICQSEKKTGAINFCKLDKFYEDHEKIYIYGAGVYGKNVVEYFKYKRWSWESFLVTEPEQKTENCILFREAIIQENDGIIIAIGSYNVFLDIWNIVRDCCDIKQLFYPNYVIS